MRWMITHTKAVPLAGYRRDLPRLLARLPVLSMFSLAFLLELNCSRERLCGQLSNPAGMVWCCYPLLPCATSTSRVQGSGAWVIFRSPSSRCWSIAEPWSHCDFNDQISLQPRVKPFTDPYTWFCVCHSSKACEAYSIVIPGRSYWSLSTPPLFTLGSTLLLQKGRQIRKLRKLTALGAPSPLDVGYQGSAPHSEQQGLSFLHSHRVCVTQVSPDLDPDSMLLHTLLFICQTTGICPALQLPPSLVADGYSCPTQQRCPRNHSSLVPPWWRGPSLPGHAAGHFSKAMIYWITQRLLRCRQQLRRMQ